MMDTPRENSTHDSGVWLLDRIMNQMNAGVYITDVDTDEILFMNSGMKKQFGLPQHRSAGRNIIPATAASMKTSTA